MPVVDVVADPLPIDDEKSAASHWELVCNSEEFSLFLN
jgi:hypothetical protein